MFATGYTEDPHKDRDDLRNVRVMLPYVWEYRGRVLLALASLLLAKVANVGVPLVLKGIVDALDPGRHPELILPVALLAAYGALKMASAFFNELRDAVFAKVRYRAMRRLSDRVLSHLLDLSLRFHLERKTGAIFRDLERGTRSVSTILNYMVFNVLPTLVEFGLVAAILLTRYDPVFTLVTFATVAIYVWFTFAITDWRMHFRHEMNRLESEANTQAVDGLINYETVKYFGNEGSEVRRYDRTLAGWEDAAVQSQTSMSALNFGQGAIIAVGVTPSQLFVNSGIPVGHRGELWVDRALRSPDYPFLLGGGDCIAVEGMRLAKVGVYAVRQNPILYHNSMAALEGTPCRRFSAGSSPMLILNMGDGTGILWKKGFTVAGEMVLRLKNFVDLRFMRKFQVSGELGESEELSGQVGIEREGPVGT